MTRKPLSRPKGQRSPGRFTHRGVDASGSCSGERWNVLAVGNYCYVAGCSAARGASAPTEGGEGRRHIVAAARLQLVVYCMCIFVLFSTTLLVNKGVQFTSFYIFSVWLVADVTLIAVLFLCLSCCLDVYLVVRMAKAKVKVRTLDLL